MPPQWMSKCSPEVFHRHCAALDVPSRVSAAPGGIPEHHLMLELALGEPEHEVRRVLLSLVDHHPGARPQLLLFQQGELPVAGELRDVEIDIAAGHVGEAFRFQTGDQIDHIRDVLGRLADDRGSGAADHRQVAEEGLRVEVRDFPDRLPLFPRPLQHLVFALVGVAGEVAHVGDVHDMADGVSEVFEGLSRGCPRGRRCGDCPRARSRRR